MVPTFSSFESIYHKGHFRKSLTQIFKFSCFSWYHAYIFEKNELDFLMQNLMLNRLAPIFNHKKEKGKACLPFYSETNLIKCFIFFPGISSDKFLFAVQPCSKVSFLLYRPKIYIKKSCNNSTSITIKNIFLHSLCFWERNLPQIREHPSSKVSLIIIKRFCFFYTRMHSSTLV